MRVYVVQRFNGPALGSVEAVFSSKRKAQAHKELLQRNGEDSVILEFTVNDPYECGIPELEE